MSLLPCSDHIRTLAPRRLGYRSADPRRMREGYKFVFASRMMTSL